MNECQVPSWTQRSFTFLQNLLIPTEIMIPRMASNIAFYTRSSAATWVFCTKYLHILVPDCQSSSPFIWFPLEAVLWWSTRLLFVIKIKRSRLRNILGDGDKGRLWLSLGLPRSQKTSQIRFREVETGEASQGQRSAVLCKFKTTVKSLFDTTFCSNTRIPVSAYTAGLAGPNSSIHLSPDRRKTPEAFDRVSWFTYNPL